MTSRHAILVLGMHRSGTSLVTRLLNLLGASLPARIMPPAPDNPSGYWEPVRIAAFNNRLLASAGVSWKSIRPLPPSWFLAPGREALMDEALTLISEEYGSSELFVLKDPRLCLLLPFWTGVFERAQISTHAILVIRDPLEVSLSLKVRESDPAAKLAAISSLAYGAMLWLRYFTDAEFHTRNMDRCLVVYERVVRDWKDAFAEIFLKFSPLLAHCPSGAEAVIDEFPDPALHRQRNLPGADEFTDYPTAIGPLRSFYREIAHASIPADRQNLHKLYNHCREIRHLLDQVVASHPESDGATGNQAYNGLFACEILEEFSAGLLQLNRNFNV